ncbi:cytidylyltransferase domain-containing protein [Idiomarina abyssalis]|uniref:acylneuraminate cytidylyltransferase family protein n=1 Tax=Idiomarina abyssalis TaxID=86102 RepID=UPI003A94F6CB
MSKTIAFVFARGGSKGLPGKNIKALCGKPLIQYSIDRALASEQIDDIYVSTDDANIAHVARECGAKVIDRPEELATDNSPEWLSWQHAINWVKQNDGSFKIFVSLPATSPLTAVVDVDSAISQLKQSGADICLSVTPSNHHPSFNMVTLDDERYASLMFNSENKVIRRQDAPKAYNITTCVYAATTDFVMQGKGLFDGKTTAIEVPRERAVDIDDIIDFKFAELLMTEQT